MGNWPAAEEAYRQGMALAEQYDQQEINLDCRMEIGDLFRKQSDYGQALSWFDAVQRQAEQSDYRAGVAKAWHYKATVFFFQGNLEAARENYLEAVRLRRELGDQREVTKGLINLGAVSRSLGDTSQARAYQEEAVSILRELNDRWPLATALNNLGNVALDLGQANDARRFLEEAVAIQREIGHQWFLGNALNNLANVAREQGDFDTARGLYGESVAIYRKLNDRWALAYLLEDIGIMKAMQAQGEQALRLAGAASQVRETISAPLSEVEQGKLDGKLRPVRDTLGAAAEAQWQAGRGLSLQAALDEAVA
jgi:tetratricopeptide (TPR) repeat protein